MTTHKVTADPNCKHCHGSGVISEHHPYGSTWAAEDLVCDCVLEQLPEEYDWKDEIDIEPAYDMLVSDGPEFEYDDYLDLWEG